jgi:hypothetical protein
MSDQDNRNDRSLLPVGHSDLAPVVPTNPLVSRGIADLAKMQDVSLEPASLDEATRPPFDVLPPSAYRIHRRLLAIGLRMRQLPGQGQHSLRLPLPNAVKPPVPDEEKPGPKERPDEDK